MEDGESIIQGINELPVATGELDTPITQNIEMPFPRSSAELGDLTLREAVELVIEQRDAAISALHLERESNSLKLTKAERDGVTDLPNRQWFETHVPDKMKSAVALPENHNRNEDTDKTKIPILALFDVDKFKEINDTYGHPVGDKVLRAFARALEKDLRDGDDVWRHGGDEFGAVMYLPLHTENKLPDLLNDIHERIEKQITEEVARIRLKDGSRIQFSGVSFAFVRYTGSETMDTLLEEVDRQLYSIKEARKAQSESSGAIQAITKILFTGARVITAIRKNIASIR